MAHKFHIPKSIYRNSEPFPEDVPRVRGYDFNQGLDHKALLQSLFNTGFQATEFGRAVREINQMVRLEPPFGHGQTSVVKQNHTHRLRSASNHGRLQMSAKVRNIHQIALA